MYLNAVVEEETELTRIDPLILVSGRSKIEEVDELLGQRTPAQREDRKFERKDPKLAAGSVNKIVNFSKKRSENRSKIGIKK